MHTSFLILESPFPLGRDKYERCISYPGKSQNVYVMEAKSLPSLFSHAMGHSAEDHTPQLLLKMAELVSGF